MMAEAAAPVCVCVCACGLCFIPSAGNLRAWDTGAFHVAFSLKYS